MPRKYYVPEKGKPFKLDIGAGKPGWQQPPEEGWIHLDVIPNEHIEIVADIGKIPVSKGTVDEIYIGDIVEHIPAWETEKVLTEWNRILKVGGLIHGRCPNLDRIMRDYANNTMSLEDALKNLYGWAVSPTEQHYYLYTKETLTALLHKYNLEITDFSGSPGPVDRPWWLVFEGHKSADIKK